MDPSEVLKLLQKLQDPNFRRQARQGLTVMCTAAAALATFILLVVILLIAHKSFNRMTVGGVTLASALNGLVVGRFLASRILKAFQQKIREKAGIPNLFGNF